LTQARPERQEKRKREKPEDVDGRGRNSSAGGQGRDSAAAHARGARRAPAAGERPRHSEVKAPRRPLEGLCLRPRKEASCELPSGIGPWNQKTQDFSDSRVTATSWMRIVTWTQISMLRTRDSGIWAAASSAAVHSFDHDCRWVSSGRWRGPGCTWAEAALRRFRRAEAEVPSRPALKRPLGAGAGSNVCKLAVVSVQPDPGRTEGCNQGQEDGRLSSKPFKTLPSKLGM